MEAKKIASIRKYIHRLPESKTHKYSKPDQTNKLSEAVGLEDEHDRNRGKTYRQVNTPRDIKGNFPLLSFSTRISALRIIERPYTAAVTLISSSSQARNALAGSLEATSLPQTR